MRETARCILGLLDGTPNPAPTQSVPVHPSIQSVQSMSSPVSVPLDSGENATPACSGCSQPIGLPWVRDRKKEETCSLHVQAPDRFPRRWVSKVPLAFCRGEGARGEAGRLRHKNNLSECCPVR